jgi:hypothetical protein
MFGKLLQGIPLAILAAAALAQAPAPAATAGTKATVPVTVSTFARAESDRYFGSVVRRDGFGKFTHNRTPTPIDRQDVVRMNRDTLYSTAVFDLDAGPVTITLPDSGKRFMSLLVIDEDHYNPPVIYAPGSITLSKDRIGTRYVQVAVRTLANANDPADIKAANALQDRIEAKQPGGPGRFEVPNWDAASQNKIRDALLALGTVSGAGPTTKRFGAKGEVDPVQHLIATAGGWGGNPPEAAVYNAVFPKSNDGKTVHRLTVKDVPVDGFWSISIYDEKGYFRKNALDSYSLNNLTARPNADGSVTVQFGGCAKDTPNCLVTPPGWNYIVRQYRPRKEILDGTWKFPEAQPVK